MINSVIHHLGIGLHNPKAAEPLFDAVLVAYLGMEKEEVQEAVAGWKGRGTRIYLYPVKQGTPPGGLQHLAFTARNRRKVEGFPAWARAHNMEILGPPRDYPEYGGIISPCSFADRKTCVSNWCIYQKKIVRYPFDCPGP